MRKSPFWRCLGLLLCLGGSCLLQAQTSGFSLGGRKSVKIPVEIQHNIILIPLQINGSFEMNFILDTGVKTTILTEPLLTSFLALDSVSRILVRGLGDGPPIEASLARDVRIALPGVAGPKINMLVLPEGLISYSSMFGRPVYGIIGYEVFGRFAVEINYQQEYIRLHEPFTYKPRRRYETLPITLRKAKPYLEATLITLEGDTLQEEWLMDTGASMAVSLLDEELTAPQPSIPAFLGQGLNGNVYGRLARSQQFQLGSHVMTDIITGYPDTTAIPVLPTDDGWYGNIGSEVISRFHVVFDYPRRQVHLKPNSSFRQPFEYNVSGLEVLSIGRNFEQFVISYVRPDSPADRAGLRVNDEVLSLNGTAVEGLEIDEIYGNLSRRHGRSVLLKIKRGDKVIKTRFKLLTEI